MHKIVSKFESISSLVSYLDSTPVNNVFKGKRRDSQLTGWEYDRFSGTKSYAEAQNLLLHGWDFEAKRLTAELKKMPVTQVDKKVSKFDVVGYQASVPRALMGLPTSMINQKKVSVPPKILNIYTNGCYSCSISADEIERKNIELVKKIINYEAEGYAVNLYLQIATETSGETIMMVVRLKASTERLSIAKLAFPLIHPSMLRRIYFNFIEKQPELTKSGFSHNYGFPDKTFVQSIYPGKENIFIS